MNKRPAQIIAISLFGIILGIFYIGNSFNLKFSLWIGSITVLLSIGLFLLWNIARIITIIFSIGIIAFYASILFAYIQSKAHFFWGVGLIFYFPIFLWSILAITICARWVFRKP